MSLDEIRGVLAADESLDPATQRALESLARALSEGLAESDRGANDAAQEDIETSVDNYLEKRQQDETPSIWREVIESLALYGDVRLRYEGNFRLLDKPDRHRARIRLRLGVNYQLHEDLLIGTRLVTGDRDDPKSTHVTFGDGFKTMEINLDRAFLTYRPSWISGAFTTLGKFNHPFTSNPVYSELLWDADVQPEGMALGYSFAGGSILDSVDLLVAAYSSLERSTSSDSFLPVAQVSGKRSITKNALAMLAVGYYFHSNVNVPDLVDRNAGNAVVDTTGDGIPDSYLSDFGILNPIFSVSLQGLPVPVVLSAEYILNTLARTDARQGWATGIACGSTRDSGDWQLYYQYQVVEQDAVFSPFSQDDFLLATDHRSHLAGVNYQVRKKIGLHAWCLVSRLDGGGLGAPDSSSYGWRVRLDLNVRF